MDIYHIWCDLRPGVKDLEFTSAVETYLDALRDAGHLSSFRVMRRKLGLGGPGEFHLMLEFDGLDKLDQAFGDVASRTEPVESFHHAVNSRVQNLTAALYRDFPDDFREEGQEKF